MKRSIAKKLFALILSVALALSFIVPAMALDGDITINILHTNDVHGRFYQVDGNNAGMMGIDKIAAIKNSTPNAILVDVGDAIHGLPIVNINEGLNAIDLMVAAGYQVMVPGNHDFNYGSLRLKELAGIASAGGLKIITSNVFEKSTGQTLLPATTIVEIEGVKVGFFGLTTTDAVILPAHVENIEFRAYKQNAENSIAALKTGGADIIIMMAHISCVEIHSLISELADKPDIVIEGHDHHNAQKTHEGVLITGAGEHQTALGKLAITIGSGGAITINEARLIPRAEADLFAGDAVVKALAEEMKAVVVEKYSEVVAVSEVLLSSFRGSDTVVDGVPIDFAALGLRNSEQPLGNLVADALRVISDADIAVTNGGGVRADIAAGDLTKGIINAVLPFGNTMAIMSATPRDIYLIMEEGLQSLPVNNGRFPQISGMSVEYDPYAPAFNKVISVSVGGAVLDRNDVTTEYSIVTNNFMASGGDGYLAFANLRMIAELGSMDDALIEYVVDVLGGVIKAENAKIECRILNVALGHPAGDRIVTLAPTRTAPGAWEVRCAHCDALLETGDIAPLKIAGAQVTTKDFISITETAKNSRVWVLKFSVTLTLKNEDGKFAGTEKVQYTVDLSGNNANLDGKFKFGAGHDLAGFTLTYDVKGNGSNIKALSIS